MRNAKPIPAPILNATCSLLSPYMPGGIEPGTLARALHGAGRDDKDNAPAHGSMLTVAEAAARLHISRRTAWRLVASGKLPVVRLSERSVRVPESALADMAAPAGENA